MKRQILILNGSPRKNKTSYSFARTLKALAEEMEHEAEIIHIIDYFDGTKSIDELRPLVASCEIIGLTSPLYVDTLPSYVIWFFETISKELKCELRGKSFFAIGQCAFPDITMNEPLIESCRLFANALEMNWLGGLSYGGGVMLNGAALESLGKKGEKMILAFRMALENILEGKRIPSRAQELLTIKIPTILNRPLAMVLNYRARRDAKKKGIDLERKVYLE